MSENRDGRNQDFWRARARQVARTVNTAWWLETMAAPLLIGAMLVAVVLLGVRREFPEYGTGMLFAACVTAGLILALVCRFLAGRKFETPDHSLVRLEAAMELRNSLSAANAGVMPWPAPRKTTDAGLHWQWPRLLVPPLGAVVLIAAGLWIPMSAKTTPAAGDPEQPQAWKQLSTEIDQLTKEAVVDEKYLEETRKRLDELKAQKEEQWFSHSSLEATDSLKKSHRAETQRVDRELGRAGKALETLEKNAGAMAQAEKNRMMEEFDQALQGLQNGAMKPNPKLLEQMKQLDLKNLAQLTPEQIEQLRENMKKNAEAMKGAQGQGTDWSDELLDGQGEGDGQGQGEGDGQGDGEDGDGNGNGGVSRGPGHAPGVLGAEKDALETGDLTGLQAKDLSKSTPGDLLELQDGEHDVDKTPSAMSEGGNTQSTGKGGDRVWKDALDPDEQRTLKKFFE